MGLYETMEKRRREGFRKPCLYNLSWNPRKISIKIEIANLAIEQIIKSREFLEKGFDYFDVLGKKYEIDEFRPFGGKNWGFGGVIEYGTLKNKLFTGFDIRIPSVFERYKDGEIARTDWKGAYNVCLTLEFIFSALGMFNEANDEESVLPEKLIEISSFRFNPGQSFYGFGLSANIYKQSFPWLEYNKESVIPNVAKAMQMANEKLIRRAEAINRFQLLIHEDMRFRIDVPGNACDIAIYPDRFMHFRSDYEEVNPHNTDTPVQQLTLLVGLAKMCDEIRKFNS